MQNAHVIIDAFNVIFGDASLHESFKRSQDTAKQQLIDLAQSLHDDEGLQVSVVFDGQGKQIDIETPPGSKHFSIIHSPSKLSADGVIERMLSRSSTPEDMIVVSNDQMIRHAAIGCGASFKSVDSFMDWTNSVQRNRSKFKRSKPERASSDFSNRIPL